MILRSLFMLAVMVVAAPALADDPPEVSLPATIPAGGQIDATVPKSSGSVYRAADAAAIKFFPLPPSRPCDKKNIIGEWQQIGVYEQIAGNPNADFKASAQTLLLFQPDGVYSESPGAAPTPDNLLKQYVVTDAGLLYYYRDGKVSGSMACFIVATQQDNFLPGQMLHMPPAPADGSIPSVRNVFVYSRPWTATKPTTRAPGFKPSR